jgi:hypothetical protein
VLSPDDESESVAAATQLSPIVDLAEPLPTSFIGENTSLHRTLIALSQWPARQWPDESAYQLALERHFRRRMPQARIEREKWMGRTRRDGLADIVIDDTVLIAVKHGFRKASADRAIEQMRRYARTLPGKPMILTVFDAPREAVFESAATPALFDLHRRHSVLTARMPTRRW